MVNKNGLTGLVFDEKGLIPAVVTDTRGTVLMVAFLNEEAVQKTLETGTMHYYSRKRKKLWLKGEESGNVQTVKEVRIDCDKDTLLFVVDQKGGACHEGYYSCFFRKWDDGNWFVDAAQLFDPRKVYRHE